MPAENITISLTHLWVTPLLPSSARLRGRAKAGIQAATGGGVQDDGFGRQGGDDGIAPRGQFGGHPDLRFREGGQNQQPPGGERGLLLWRDALGQATGRADHNWRYPAQEYAQAFLLHRRVEPADHAPAFLAPGGGLVVGGQNNAARTASGAEQRGHGEQ